MMPSPVIETLDLTKTYGSATAVHELNLCIPEQRITAFLGLNGAGKSTTIKMLLGMTRPTSGIGRLLGAEINDIAQSTIVRQRVAFVSETKRLYDYMTVDEMLAFTKAFYTDWRPGVEQRLIRTFALPRERKIKALSKGMRTKVALLLAFARQPDLLILDEPTDGLDPLGVEQMLEEIVAQNAAGTSVLFSSHQIAEVERIADHVCIMHGGHLVLDDSLDAIRSDYRRIDFVETARVEDVSNSTSGLRSMRRSGRQTSLLVSNNHQHFVERVAELGGNAVEVNGVGLREVFLDAVKEI